jgi:hypothetical protein
MCQAWLPVRLPRDEPSQWRARLPPDRQARRAGTGNGPLADRILNNVLNNNEVLSRNQDVLNSLLRDANILTENQVVVGVLSGGQIVFQDV